MLAQSTFFVALLATIALGALSTNLISTGVAHQQQIIKFQSIATDNAVDNFTSLMQSYVAEHGSEGPWPATLPNSASTALCPRNQGSNGCSFNYVVSASITGFSSTLKPPSAAGNGPDDTATNLQSFIIDEQRISASVTAIMTDAGGSIVSSNTRFITMRVFNSPPFAMVSGQHSIQSANGSSRAIEADSGGEPDDHKLLKPFATPNPSNPNGYHNTEIKSSMNCETVDDIPHPDSSAAPTHNQGRGNRGLQWGIGGAGGYELPCTNAVSTPSPGSFRDEQWQNGNLPQSGSD